MNIAKILFAIFIISLLFVLQRFNIYIKIPGFYGLYNLFLSPQDICGLNFVDEVKKSRESIEKSVSLSCDFRESEFFSSISNCSFWDKNLRLKIIVSRIFPVSPDKFPEEFMILSGKNDGVKRYSLVMKDGFLFGRVVDVFDRESRVISIFSPQFFVDSVFVSSGVRAILRGNENGFMNVFASLGPIEYADGDVALTSGSKFSLPEGIKIGRLYGEKIRVFANVENLVYVSVVVPISDEED